MNVVSQLFILASEVSIHSCRKSAVLQSRRVNANVNLAYDSRYVRVKAANIRNHVLTTKPIEI